MLVFSNLSIQLLMNRLGRSAALSSRLPRAGSSGPPGLRLAARVQPQRKTRTDLWGTLWRAGLSPEEKMAKATGRRTSPHVLQSHEATHRSRRVPPYLSPRGGAAELRPQPGRPSGARWMGRRLPEHRRVCAGGLCALPQRQVPC